MVGGMVGSMVGSIVGGGVIKKKEYRDVFCVPLSH